MLFRSAAAALQATPKLRLSPEVRLLPAFDTYLLGYRNRELTVPQSPLRRRLQRGGGWLHPAVIVNGRAVGAWHMARAAKLVMIEPFEKLSLGVRAGIEAEARDISRFLGLPLQTKIGEPVAKPAPQLSERQ